MEGVEILFAEEVTHAVWNGFVWHWGLAFLVFIGLILVGTAIYSFWNGISDGETDAMVIIGIIFLIAGIICFYFNGTVPVYDHTEYKVTVDETVNMNEFFKKYELVDQEGKIYIVKNEVPLSEE